MQRLHYSALVAEDYDCYCFEIIVTVILVARVNTSCCLLITARILLCYHDYPYNCKLMAFITAAPVINADINFITKVKHGVK